MNIQELEYGPGYDYWSGSPHLKHRVLAERLLVLATRAVDSAARAGLDANVLEIGAGDGAISERLLAMGCHVTGTETSRASVETLRRRFGRNDRFEAVLDPDGTLDALAGQRYGVVVFVSVLHHIPDYLNTLRMIVDRHLAEGGALLSFQDPLWYPTTPGQVRVVSEFAYLSWRVTQGHISRGLRTRLRRARHGLSETELGDTVEYHVVRAGVDQEAIRAQLEPDFASVDVLRYWSSQSNLWQRVGARLGFCNTFAVLATGFQAP